MKIRTIAAILLSSLLAQGQSSASREANPGQQSQENASTFLSFDDLVALSSTANPEVELLARLNRLLTTPVMDNTRVTRPRRRIAQQTTILDLFSE
jgi:hypothetical protein